MSKMIDMVGQKFGELEVIENSGQRFKNDGSILWKTRCSCGKEKLLPRYLLLKYKSCGCKNKYYQSLSLRKSLNRGGYEEIFATHWNGIRKNSVSRGLEFNIDVKYAWELFLKQNRKCALTGVPLKFSTKCWSRDATASLDRINSDMGYTKDNIQWVHKEVNMMKQQYETEKFFDWCKKIVEYNKL